MKNYIYGLLTVVAIGSSGALFVVMGGWLPIAAVPPESPIVSNIIHTAYEKSVARAAKDISVPSDYSQPARVLRGAYNFDAMCAGCHTPPGTQASVQVQGMNPRPPALDELLQQRSPEQAFWVIRNGVRMTAMPAFGPTHEDEELWALVAFLQTSQSMGSAEYVDITARARAANASGDGHNHSHGPSSPHGHAAEAHSERSEEHADSEEESSAPATQEHHDEHGATSHEHSALPHAPASPINLPKIVVYKSPTCGCCNKWIEHVQASGFTVDAVEDADLNAVKSKYGVPGALRSCHTAVVGSYVIEGHVPAEDILSLLKRRPAAQGLAVAGMPAGSPGMEMGARQDPYTVWMFAQHAPPVAFSRRGDAE